MGLNGIDSITIGPGARHRCNCLAASTYFHAEHNDTVASIVPLIRAYHRSIPPHGNGFLKEIIGNNAFIAIYNYNIETYCCGMVDGGVRWT